MLSKNFPLVLCLGLVSTSACVASNNLEEGSRPNSRVRSANINDAQLPQANFPEASQLEQTIENCTTIINRLQLELKALPGYADYNEALLDFRHYQSMLEGAHEAHNEAIAHLRTWAETLAACNQADAERNMRSRIQVCATEIEKWQLKCREAFGLLSAARTPAIHQCEEHMKALTNQIELVSLYAVTPNALNTAAGATAPDFSDM